ncbi:hypothetical protein FACS189487_00820 [Campylobacterota bacterium]|nr:hypothetical protein FACS189487_00820 [Campylobacterota bacterium]
MVLFLTGVPGSGKTYFAVNYLYDTFVNNKSKHFGANKRFITNIEGFNYGLFDNKGKALDFENLKNQLTFLYRMKDSGCADTELLEKIKEFELDSALFIIDECHTFLSKDDEILVWWLSYHRHFFHNILLVTQNLALVNRKYYAFSEFFYSAQASSLRIFSWIFRYKVFTDARLYKKTETKGFTLKFNKDVYALYHSGDNQQSKKVVVYYILIAFFLFILFIAVMYSIPKIWMRSASVDNNTSKPATNVQTNNYVPRAPNVYLVICRYNDCYMDGHRFYYSQIHKHFLRSVLHTQVKDDYKEHLILIEDDKKYLLGIKQ